MKKRNILLVLTVLLAASLLGCAQMSAKEIAKKVVEKYESIKDMKGVMVEIMNFNGKRRVEVVEFAMKKPNKYWSNSKNMTIVSNGSVLWVYDKRKNEVYMIRLNGVKRRPKFDYGRIVEELMKSNEIKLLGTGTVAGRKCYIIEVKPKNVTFSGKEILWIDEKYWYPLKIEISYGPLSYTIIYKSIEFNTYIPDSLFNFKPPKGAKVVRKVLPPKKLTLKQAQRLVNFTILVPSYTAGYRFKYAYVFKSNGKEMVMMYYYKNGETMMITESRGYAELPLLNSTKISVNGTKYEISCLFGRYLIRFKKGNVVITVSAKMPKNALLRVALSFHKI